MAFNSFNPFCNTYMENATTECVAALSPRFVKIENQACRHAHVRDICEGLGRLGGGWRNQAPFGSWWQEEEGIK